MRLIAIAGSAGSLPALESLVGELPPDLDAAIVIVTHRPASFRSHLAEILGRSGALPVREARDGDPLTPGRIFIAPAGLHHACIEGGHCG